MKEQYKWTGYSYTYQHEFIILSKRIKSQKKIYSMTFYIESKSMQMSTWEVKLLTKARKLLLKKSEY